MTPARWQQIKDIFDSALDVPTAERGSFVADACPGDPQLLAEVERLLHQHDTAGDFLEQPVIQAGSLIEGELVSKRYRIGKLLGRGGMGEVYEAHDQFLNEAVAIKTLRADLSRNENVVRRFQREIQLARKVTHPNVCRVFEVGVHELASGPMVRYFTMDLLRGETLSARLRRKGKLARAEAYPLAAQMADGLQAAHAAGIVHTDFKSGNVILVPGPHGEKAVITDFGLARPAPALTPGGETASMSAFGHVAGTVAYMSPEQLSGGIITPASDIYSFGIVLFEMATGKLPFDDRHLIQSAMQRASGEVDVRALTPNIDQRWEAAIFRCLQKNPKQRFASAADLAAWFHHGGAWTASYKYWTRRDWIRASAAAAGVVAVGGGSWYAVTRPYAPKRAALEWYEKGQAALHSMTYEAARREFEQAVLADPKFALAHASLARTYDEMEYSGQAQETMLRAIAVGRETRLSSADQTRLRALQALVSRDFDRAVPLFQQLESTANEAEKPSAVLESGWLAEKRDDTSTAASAYERAVKLDPSYAAAKLRLGFILTRKATTENDAAALAAFADAERLYGALSDYEGITETLLQRANLLNRRSRASEALPVIDRALAVARTVGNRYQEIRLRLLQGTATRNNGDAVRAAEIARQAIAQAVAERMDNLATSGQVDLANTYLQRGELQTAEPLFQGALELARGGKVRHQEARAQFSLGSLYEQDHRPEQAKRLLDAALPFFRQGGYRRELILTRGVLGGVEHQLAEYDQGIRVLRDALESVLILQDSHLEAQVRGRLAENLRESGDWPRALKELEQAAHLPGQLPGEIEHYRSGAAGLLWRLGRTEDARTLVAEIKQSLASRPNQEVLFDISLLEARMLYAEGRLEQAGRFAKTLRTPDVGSSTEAELLQALIVIRTSRGNQGREAATEAIRQFDQNKLSGEAAAARLSLAEALVTTTGRNAVALELTKEAVGFAEPRKVWESVWRARLIARKASPEHGDADKAGADLALTQLRSLWGGPDLERYLQRPDVRKLAD